MARKKYDVVELDEYEQSIEDSLHEWQSVMTSELKQQLQEAAKQHIEGRQSITIRVQRKDLIAIKAKAAKRGLPYQTYINMLFHQDATAA